MNWSAFTPHGFCLAWDPGLIWLQAGSDLAIALAYYSIPAALLVFLRRRRDLAFKPVFGLFAVFILACGTTHVMAVITLWQPLYWLDGGLKAVTAALSVATAIVLWPLLPKALALPSPAALRDVNERLARQVAERDAAVEGLRAREQQLAQLYERSPAVLQAVDARGLIEEVSDRWLELFGYQRAQVIGRPIMEFYAPETHDAVRRHSAELAAGGGALRVQRVVVCASGERRITEATITLEYDAPGSLRRMLVALTDITARLQAEVALQASEERLRHAQKMEAVGQLTGGIAHDFNNLLTTIMGSLEMLERRPGLDERGLRLTGNALEGAKRAARLTSQLLSFSRRARLQPESLELPAVLEGVREMLERSVGEGVALVLPGPDAMAWRVLADRNQLEVSLLNLLLNARDAINAATSDGAATGSVTITFTHHTLAPSDTDRLSADPMAPGDYVGISVTDTGCGMPPEVLAHAFEPFFTTKRTGAGTGLGLAQTYGFATQSGGTVRIDSTLGQGTRVEIILPRAIGPVAYETGIVPDSALLVAAGHGETILVVEDDALLRHTVAIALEEYGYQVVATANGAAALAALATGQHFDLLLTDVMMPGGMNGVDVARAARASRANLKIMFATGYSDRKVLAPWPEPLDLLSKPYTPAEMAQRVAARLAAVDGVLLREE